MSRTWFGKPLPWILFGLVFFEGYQAISWREELFGFHRHYASVDFHVTILYGFTALYNVIIRPLAYISIVACGGGLLLVTASFRRPDRTQFRCGDFLRAWKSVRESPTTRKESIKICWAAFREGPFVVRGHRFHINWPDFWPQVRWLLMFGISYWACIQSMEWIQATSHILDIAAETSLKNALSEKGFRGLILHGYPGTALASILALIGAAIATWFLFSWSDTWLKNVLTLVPTYILCTWLLVFAPKLAGFELALKPCPRIRLIADPKTIALTATALPPEILRDRGLCYLVSEDQGSDALLIIDKSNDEKKRSQFFLFVVPKLKMPPYEIESSENVLLALASQ